MHKKTEYNYSQPQNTHISSPRNSHRNEIREPLCSASVEDAIRLIRKIAPNTHIETRYIDETDGSSDRGDLCTKGRK